jgi:hypothetical protein
MYFCRMIKIEADLTTKITRLLCDHDNDNFALILELIASSSVNARILGYLMGISAFHTDDLIGKRAFSILEKNTGKNFSQKVRHIKESFKYHLNEAEVLFANPNLGVDVFDVILAYKMTLWHQNNEKFSDFKNVVHETLNLSNYMGNQLPESLLDFDFIKYIALPTHKNFDLVASIPMIKNMPLLTLQVEGSKMEHLPVEIFRFANLKALYLKKGQSRQRIAMKINPEDGIFASESLEILQIEAYPMLGVEFLGDFPNLKKVSIINCQLQSVDFLKNSKKLENLSLNFNQLSKFPSFLSELTELRTLFLNHNPLMPTSMDFSQLKKLEELEFNFSIHKIKK